MPQTCARLGCMPRQLAVSSVHQALVSTNLRWAETAAAQKEARSVPQSGLASLRDCCQPRHANLRFHPAWIMSLSVASHGGLCMKGGHTWAAAQGRANQVRIFVCHDVGGEPHPSARWP